MEPVVATIVRPRTVAVERRREDRVGARVNTAVRAGGVDDPGKLVLERQHRACLARAAHVSGRAWARHQAAGAFHFERRTWREIPAAGETGSANRRPAVAELFRRPALGRSRAASEAKSPPAPVRNAH